LVVPVNLEIPPLNPNQLYTGEIPTDLFGWRTASLAKARGRMVSFFCEPDFSLWRNAPIVEQIWSVYRMRTLGRRYQSAGIPLIPNLAWSDKRSFTFAFQGIPRGCRIAACEARTAGQTDEDRERFLAGLNEAVRQVQPQHILIYGGTSHQSWLNGALPTGPTFHLLDSWNTSRDKKKKAEQDRNQLILFRREPWHGR
jgi:hypothetical protein